MIRCRHYWSSWDGDAALAISLGVIIGRRLGARDLGVLISGVHVCIAYFFGSFHLFIGPAYKGSHKPTLKFLQLQ
jgi:hypothetical protein